MDIVAFLSSISFDSSTLEIWSALLNGLTLVIPARVRLSPDVVAEAISTFKVTVMFLTPGLFNLMVEEHLACLASVRYVISGGDVMSPAIAHRALRHLLNTKIINGYGPTETRPSCPC
ncbi:AMP-binding protein [Paenibacillus sp. 598K]|uniref:AMP-binding protein n=1 Tax=Paenibacillus sp. 598K TaxID=1117987 RepID=UPI0021AA96D9|nr:AMP-binding protein [Paenibacillus sp. 598K]